jgi:hypothetical protein
MRGGTANCTVVIADDEIGSPLAKHPPLAITLNLPSFDKYEESLAPGGTLIVNQSMVDRGPKRTDINVILVPCNDIAEEIGDKKLMNMVAVGALLQPCQVPRGCGESPRLIFRPPQPAPKNEVFAGTDQLQSPRIINTFPQARMDCRTTKILRLAGIYQNARAD